MNRAQIHFEVFTKGRNNAPWSLQLATEDRAHAVESAEELLTLERNAAVKVCKETLDPVTREFRSVTVFSKGVADNGKKHKEDDQPDTPLCITPQDLYSAHARERIGRLLDGWLRRRSVTPFELLHRPDLAEALDASGVELQHAVQKISIPEAQARGLTTHEVIRTFQGLIGRSIERVIKDGKNNLFPNVTESTFAEVAIRLTESDGERAYLLGGGVASHLAPGTNWADKVGLILDLADRAPDAGRPRGLALSVLEQPLTEIMGSAGGLADLLGAELDLGGSLAALVRLAASEAVEAVIRYDPNLLELLPPLTGHAVRLSIWLEQEGFEVLRQGLMRRVLRELLGPRRLRPGNPDGEILMLRALAMAMTAAAGKLLPIEDVHHAFIQRSKALVAGDFVDSFLQGRDSALADAQALIRLVENVAGAANKKAAGRWLAASVETLRFEKEMRQGAGTAAVRLAALAALQRGVSKAGLADGDRDGVMQKIGDLGGLIEAEARLVAAIVQADAPAPHRLTLLLRIASGEAAPRGPATDRAKIEALKLLRSPETRADLATLPDVLERVKGLMTQSGLAA